MNKEMIVKEMWRDLHGLNADAVKNTLSKSGWTEQRFTTSISQGKFYAHLYEKKDGLKLYFFFTDAGLDFISTE